MTTASTRPSPPAARLRKASEPASLTRLITPSCVARRRVLVEGRDGLVGSSTDTDRQKKAGNGAQGRVPTLRASAQRRGRQWAGPAHGRDERQCRAEPATGGARGSDETKASASQRQGGLRGGGRQEPSRREPMAELGETAA